MKAFIHNNARHSLRRNALRMRFAALAAIAASVHCAAVRAVSVITGYQFTNDTFNPTTLASNLTASPFGYVNANPSSPPFTNPPFIVQGGILPDDPAFFIGQGDWYPAGGGFNEDYYTFKVSVAPGFAINVGSLSFYANSRQQVPFLTQVQYSTNSNFTNAISFDTNPIALSTAESWSTYTASDAPIAQGVGTYYFRIYNELDPNGNGTISDLMNMSRVNLNGSVITATAATPMYWDPANAGAPGSGGSGTWLTANTWADGALDYSWSSTIAETAIFAGPSGGNVSLGGIVSALNGISFTTPGYTITGAASDTLILGGTILTTADANISAHVTTAAAGTLFKSGSATLTIAGPANFATGTSLTISAGTLAITSGGSVTVNGAIQNIAALPGDVATLTLTGNATFTTDASIHLADQGGNGTLNIQDTAVISTNTLIVGKGILGTGGTGTVNQNGGTILAGSVSLATDDSSSVGTYHLNAGTLIASSIFGGSGNSTFLFNGGTFQANANSTTLFSNITNLQVQNGGAIIDTNTYNIALAQTLAPATGSTGGLTKIGAGTLTFNLAATVTGPININAGTLVATVPAAGGTFPNASAINVYYATLQLGNAANQTNVLGNGANTPPLFVTGGTVTTFSGTAQNLGIVHLSNGTLAGSATPQSPYADYTLNNTVFADGNGTLSTISAAGGIGLNGNITFNVTSPSAELDIPAVITNAGGAGSLVKAGPGLLVLSNANTFSGNTTVSAGTLKYIGHTLPTTNISIASGATLEYNLSNRTFQTTTTFTGNGTLRASGTGQLVFGGTGNVNINFSPGALIDLQSGLLFGSSSYGGLWTNNQASLNIAPGATFDAVEAGPTGTMHIDALTGGGTFTGGYQFNNGGLSTLTLGIAGGSGTFSGNLGDDASAHLAVVKAGAGTQTFSGNNTYTGGTSVNAGTLLLASSAALAANSTLSIAANATVTESNNGIGAPLTLKLTTLSIAGSTSNWTGDFNLTNSKLIIEAPSTHETTLATLRNQAAFGRTHTAGITSTALPVNEGIAVLDNAITHFTTFGSQTVDTSSILLSPELLGDANGDGHVDLTDLAIVLNNFGTPTSAWTSGNFDNAPTIDVADVTDVLNNFGASNPNTNTSPQLTPADYQSPITPTPEPASLALLASAILLLRMRRH